MTRESMTDESQAQNQQEITYCPWCGYELDIDDDPLDNGHTDAHGDCPTHGKIRIEVRSVG